MGQLNITVSGTISSSLVPVTMVEETVTDSVGGQHVIRRPAEGFNAEAVADLVKRELAYSFPMATVTDVTVTEAPEDTVVS